MVKSNKNAKNSGSITAQKQSCEFTQVCDNKKSTQTIKYI